MADFNKDTGTEKPRNGEQAVCLMPKDKEEDIKFGDELNENEAKFFQLVKQETAEEIDEFRKTYRTPLIDLNKKDEKFRTVLQIAVCRGDLKIVKGLVNAGCRDPNALKLAAALHRDDIVQVFIEATARDSRIEDLTKEDEEQLKKLKLEQEIRKTLKAAVDAEDYKGTMKLIKYLQSDFPNALKLQCHCLACRQKAKADADKADDAGPQPNILQDANDRVEVCHILSSPAFILITSDHPFHKALEWAKHLRIMAYWHPENKIELQALAARSSKLAVDLLATCSADADTKLLFKVDENTMTSTLKYKCLHDAIGDEQKQFIAHPACQHVISQLWFGPYYEDWRIWSTIRRLWHIVWQILLMPVIFILFIFRVKFARKCLKCPLNRFIYATVSYIFFLAHILGNEVVEKDKELPTQKLDYFDIVIVIWVAAHICKLIHDFISQRRMSHARLWWTIYNTITMAFFVAGAIVFIVGYNKKTDIKWHLVLLSQGLYGIAMTMACLRILQWLHLSSRLGPLVVSFSKMTTILQKFFVVYAVVVFSFSFGIHTVYKNFETDLPPDKKFDTFFSSYRKSLKLILWAVFGKGEVRFATIPENHHYFVKDSMNHTIFFEDSFSVKVGYTLWYIYHLAVLIILLNMFIAVMTNFYQTIQDNADTEWKFACTELRLYYIEKSNMFPPPLNVFVLAYKLGISLYNRCVKSCGQNKGDDFTDATKIDKLREKRKEVVKDMKETYVQDREFDKIIRTKAAELRNQC